MGGTRVLPSDVVIGLHQRVALCMHGQNQHFSKGWQEVGGIQKYAMKIHPSL